MKAGRRCVGQSKEEDSLTPRERDASSLAARSRARARRRRLRWRRWRRRGAGGTAVVVVHGDRVRGRRGPGLHHRVRFPAAGLVAHADPADRRGDPARAEASATGRPATTTSASSRATTRPHRRASGTRASARQNANAYAANDKVIGVIGTFNSGCAAIIIPVLNQAPDGGIAMVSPANTYPCLTVNLPGGCDSTEPDKYYPAGTRNYARVVPADDYQGAAVAEFAQSKGIKKRLHPERQGGLRPRRRDDLPQGSRVASASRSRASRPGIRRPRATRRCSRRSKAPARTQSSSAA